jgi:hypothetical protein
MFRTFVCRLPLLLVLALPAACGDDDPTPIDPTPIPEDTTETFTGSLNPNGGITHPFNAARSGTITATLTSVAPDATVTVGLSLGTWNGASCQIVIANDRATQGTVVIGTGSSLGPFCVRLYDIGSLAETITYEVQVRHP